MKSELIENTFENKGCTLHYWMGGKENAPLLVFTHGAYIDHHEWDGTLSVVLDAGYRVVAWDLRGHGLSRPGVFSVGAAVEDLMCLLDLLKVEQAIFIGHSLGGNIGQELTFQHSERVKALVSVGCTWNFQKLSAVENLGVKVGVPLIGLYPYDTLVRQMAEVSADKPESKEYLRRAFSVLAKDEFVQVMKEATACLHYEPDYVLPVPMLLIVGDKDQTGNIRKVAPLWAAHEKHCTFVLVPEGMHAFNLDMPEIFHESLLKFLAEQK